MEAMTVEAEGLALTRWTARHVDKLEATYADKEIERFLVMPLPWGKGEKEGFLDRTDRLWTGNQPTWAVTDNTGDLLGSISLRHTYVGICTVSYITSPWARGQGVATRALRAATKFAFEQLKVKRVEWDAICGNHFSRLAALRVGYQMEGLSRGGVNQRGVQRDIWLGGIGVGEVREADAPPLRYDAAKAQAIFFSRAQESRERLKGEGFSLRPLQDEDRDDLVFTCADPLTQKFTTVPKNYTENDGKFFLKLQAQQYEYGTALTYAIADDNDRYCGTVGLDNFGNAEAELGYLIAPWARGNGLVTKAAKLLCQLGFDELGLEKINWCAAKDNRASVRVAEKVGFTVEGMRRQALDGREGRCDQWVASLLPREINS